MKIVISQFTVACESGTYKDGDMTICQTCPDGYEPNQNKTACGKRKRESSEF